MLNGSILYVIAFGLVFILGSAYLRKYLKESQKNTENRKRMERMRTANEQLQEELKSGSVREASLMERIRDMKRVGRFAEDGKFHRRDFR